MRGDSPEGPASGVCERDRAPLPPGPVGVDVERVAVLRQVVFAYGAATASVLDDIAACAPLLDVFGETDNVFGQDTCARFRGHLAPCLVCIASRSGGFAVACAASRTQTALRPRSAVGDECDGFEPMRPDRWHALCSGDMLALWHRHEGVHLHFEFLTEADLLASNRPRESARAPWPAF